MRFLLIALSLLLSSCSTPPYLYYGSHVDEAFGFSKSQRIIVAAPPNAAESDLNYLPIIAQAFSKAGFTVVDSLADAERIVSFRIDTTLVLDYKFGTKKVYRRDSSYVAVQIYMLDVKAYAAGHHSQVWQALVWTPEKFLSQCPAEIVAKPISLYGKNEVREERFHVPHD